MPNWLDILKIFDSYEIKARLFPGFMIFLPIGLIYLGVESGSFNAVRSVIIAFLAVGGAYALANIVREFGKRAEIRLFDKWGGKPTTIMLRHSDLTIDRFSKQKYHAHISKHALIQMPTPEQETGFPREADEAYRAATIWLLGQTRDNSKFLLLFKENIGYGYSRNMLGVRYLGIATASFSLAWGIFRAGIISLQKFNVSPDSFSRLGASAGTAIVLVSLILCIWIFFITENLVLRAARTFAERLIVSIDQM